MKFYGRDSFSFKNLRAYELRQMHKSVADSPFCKLDFSNGEMPWLGFSVAVTMTGK